jgi:LacI family gluconate utilization system Gnt-I transcriptional repressor
MPASPTLADVARLAGVSEVTVSRVVRNKGPISATTRQVVTTAVQTLGYVPNRAAGALASAASKLVAVLLPSLSNVVFAEVLRGVHAGLAGTEFQAMVGVTDYDPAQEERLLSALLAWHPAAVITTGFDHNPASRKMLANPRLRVAEVMEIGADPIDLAVGLSHDAAGRASVQHLVARGYRRIGYVGHDLTADLRAGQRRTGILAGLAQAGLRLEGEALYPGPSSSLAGRDALAALLGRSPNLDAVIFSNDDMAVGGYFHCLAAGIAVRDKLALFGFNGLEIGQALPRPLSTLRSNRFLIGQVAVTTVLAQNERPSLPVSIDTGFEIVTGDTA